MQPQSKDAPNNPSGIIPCKKCKSMPTAGLTCIKCNSLSHPSCVKLLKNIQYLSETTIICCENADNVKSAPSQFKKMELSTEDIEDFVKKITLPLVQQIEMLRNEVRELKDSNLELVRLLTLNNPSVPAPVKCTFPHYPPLITKPSVNCNELLQVEKTRKRTPALQKNNLNYQERNGDIKTDKKACQQQPSTCESSDEESKSCDLIENPWTEQRTRRNRRDLKILRKEVLPTNNTNDNNSKENSGRVQKPRQNRKQRASTITGTLQVNDNLGFCSNYVKRAWYYVGKVNKNVDTTVIKSYIASKLSSEDVIVDNLNLQGTTYDAYKVGVNFRFKDDLLKEDFWPQGVCVRRFNFPRNNFLGKIPTTEATSV